MQVYVYTPVLRVAEMAWILFTKRLVTHAIAKTVQFATVSLRLRSMLVKLTKRFPRQTLVDFHGGGVRASSSSQFLCLCARESLPTAVIAHFTRATCLVRNR